MPPPDTGKTNQPAPFEWLAGGLFFGKSFKGGIESIDSCKDVMALLNGIDDNLTSILDEKATETSKDNEEVASGEEKEDSAEFIAARLSRLRFLLFDERRSSSQDFRRSTPTVAGATMQGLTGDSLAHLTPKLLNHLNDLPFESRKHVATIFNYLLVCGLDGSDAELYQPIMLGFRDYVATNFEAIMTPIVNGYDCSSPGCSADIGLHSGSMYRSCLRHLLLYQLLLCNTERVEKYVFPLLDKYVHVPNFDISSDAMETLRVVFTAGGDTPTVETTRPTMAEVAAEFLTRDYDAVWDKRFNPMLLSEKANYMTRRIALQILSTVLLTRVNYAIMIRYVASRENLILAMKNLRSTSSHITLDAFHVFKVFVANPNKPPEIVKILKDNRVKLCRYLETLHQELEGSDTQFRDEKALIIATIEAL